MKTESTQERLRLSQETPRRSQRIRLQVPVFVRGVEVGGADFVELTKTLNISASGACIASTHVMRPDKVVQLTFPAPSSVFSSTIPAETPPIPARVKRQEPSGELRLIGVEFLRPLE